MYDDEYTPTPQDVVCQRVDAAIRLAEAVDVTKSPSARTNLLDAQSALVEYLERTLAPARPAASVSAIKGGRDE